MSGVIPQRLANEMNGRYPDLNTCTMHVSNEPSCVKEWDLSGLPNFVWWSSARVGKLVFQGGFVVFEVHTVFISLAYSVVSLPFNGVASVDLMPLYVAL